MDAPNQQNSNLQDPNAIVSSLVASANAASNAPVPSVAIPSLNYVMPSGSDIQAQYQTFLTQVSNDPNLVNYYNQLLQYAQGDTNVAIQQLQNDYKTTVQQTTDTLQNSLGQLGLTFTGESNSLLDNLNKRGIALTQGDNGKNNYAGGGESGTELSQLNQSQTLRQEAQQRSAQQNIQTAGNTLNKGITNANNALQTQAIGIQQQKQNDITNIAGQEMDNYNASLYSTKQAQVNSGGGSGGGIAPIPGVTGDSSARAAGYSDYSAYQHAVSGTST